MNAITTFPFEAAELRVVDLAGEPWFVAADVCGILELSNPTMALKALDDDERAKFNLGRQGEVGIISEGGLYTLILRSRDATTPGTPAHRFRKWVTAVVLPAIRRTGRYDPVPRFDAVDVPWMVATNNLLRTAIRLHGPRAARPLWERFGLPPIEAGPQAMLSALDPQDQDEDELAELMLEWVGFHDAFTIPELADGCGITDPTQYTKRKIGKVLRHLGFTSRVERRGENVHVVFRKTA